MKREIQYCKVKFLSLQKERVILEEKDDMMKSLQKEMMKIHPLLHHHLLPLPHPLLLIHLHISQGCMVNPLLKLDIKFELPIYNGEVNVERLDN